MKKIKYFNLAKAMLTSCILFAAVSCEKEQEVSVSSDLNETESLKLATFKFPGGNTLELIQDIEAGEPSAMSIESSPIGKETFIDFDKSSMLDVYLALTPESYPVPEVLIDATKSYERARVQSKRQIVEKPDHPVLLNIKEIPADLLKEPANNQKTNNSKPNPYCEGITGKDHCMDWTFTKRHQWTAPSSKKTRTIEFQTSVSGDSEYLVALWTWYKLGGVWYKNMVGGRVEPGQTKRYRRKKSAIKYRRRLVRESVISADVKGKEVNMRGWIDVRN